MSDLKQEKEQIKLNLEFNECIYMRDVSKIIFDIIEIQYQC